jgi:hypothetical protein
MKTQISASVRMGIVAAVAALSISFFGCSKDNANTPVATTDSSVLLKESTLNYTTPENTTYIASSCVLPNEELSEAEASALIYMREEEMLAHDGYLTFSAMYPNPVFKNIRNSEAIHTEAVRRLLVKYNLPDPMVNHVAGTFANPEFQGLYNSLVATGTQSLLKAMTVGATIEDLDIYDLKNRLLVVDNRDITFVFNNLMNGSKNHLRAFYANILFLGGTHIPQYLTQEEFNAIINS